jgi:hypothetical protein
MRSSLLICLFLLLSCIAAAKEIPPVPKTYIQDNTGTIEKSYWDSINNLLADLEAHTGTQFIVYIDNSLEDEALEPYVTKLFNAWELGKNGKNNGMLLAVFLQEKSFRIEIGYGLEGKIPDLLSTRYQENYLIPEFKNGNYGKGVLNCSKALADAASGYLYNFFGEKKQREIDSLIIKDEARVLNAEQIGKVFYDLHKASDYGDYSEFNAYYFITSSGDETYMKSRMQEIWKKIGEMQGFVENKILIGVSTGKPFFSCITDPGIQKDLSLQPITYISTIHHGDFILDQWKTRDYYYVLYNAKDAVVTDISYKRFEKRNPIYSGIFSPFFANKKDLIGEHEDMLIWSALVLALIIPVFLIILIVLLSRHLETKTKKILIAWSLLNNLLPFVGYLLQVLLLIRVFKLFFKKGNYEEKIKVINEKSYFGYLESFFSGGGSGGSYSYSSSGSSYSWGSSYSSSSGSSSSSRSFGGGGGGRSGGGGSSGKW